MKSSDILTHIYPDDSRGDSAEAHSYSSVNRLIKTQKSSGVVNPDECEITCSVTRYTEETANPTVPTTLQVTVTVSNMVVFNYAVGSLQRINGTFSTTSSTLLASLCYGVGVKVLMYLDTNPSNNVICVPGSDDEYNEFYSTHTYSQVVILGVVQLNEPTISTINITTETKFIKNIQTTSYDFNDILKYKSPQIISNAMNVVLDDSTGALKLTDDISASICGLLVSNGSDQSYLSGLLSKDNYMTYSNKYNYGLFDPVVGFSSMIPVYTGSSQYQYAIIVLIINPDGACYLRQLYDYPINGATSMSDAKSRFNLLATTDGTIPYFNNTALSRTANMIPICSIIYHTNPDTNEFEYYKYYYRSLNSSLKMINTFSSIDTSALGELVGNIDDAERDITSGLVDNETNLLDVRYQADTPKNPLNPAYWVKVIL